MPVYGLILAFGLSILDVAPMGMRVVFTVIVAAIDVLLPMLLILLLKGSASYPTLVSTAGRRGSFLISSS